MQWFSREYLFKMLNLVYYNTLKTMSRIYFGLLIFYVKWSPHPLVLCYEKNCQKMIPTYQYFMEGSQNIFILTTECSNSKSKTMPFIWDLRDANLITTMYQFSPNCTAKHHISFPSLLNTARATITVFSHEDNCSFWDRNKYEGSRS